MQRRFDVRFGLIVALGVASVALAQSQPAPAPSAGPAAAPPPALRAVLPPELRWVSPPQLPGMQFAWVLGAESEPGPYVLRVRLAQGARIPPHTHPDARITTVLEGTLYVGFGEKVEPSRAMAVPAGGVYVVPAKVAHYLLAKEGEALYQENGVGPTATAMTTD